MIATTLKSLLNIKQWPTYLNLAQGLEAGGKDYLALSSDFKKNLPTFSTD